MSNVQKGNIIMNNNLMIFENKKVEVFEWKGQVLFNPYHCGRCLDLSESAVRMAIGKMNNKQVVKLTNSNVKDIDFRKLHNTGENFLTESGVFLLLGIDKWEDLDIRRYSEAISYIDESVRIIKLDRPQQISLFD